MIGLINYTLRSERISASDQNLSNKLLDRFCFHFGNRKESYGSDRQFRVITALLYYLDENEVLKASENLQFLEQVVTKIFLQASLGRSFDDIVKLAHTLKLKLGMEAKMAILDILLEKIENEFSDVYLDVICCFDFSKQVLEGMETDCLDTIFRCKSEVKDVKKYIKALVALTYESFQLQDVLFEVLLSSTSMSKEISFITEIDESPRKSVFLTQQLEILRQKLHQDDIILNNIDYLSSSLSLQIIDGNTQASVSVMLTILDHSNENLVHHLKDLLDKFRFLLDNDFSTTNVQATTEIFHKFSEKLLLWHSLGNATQIENLSITILEYVNFIMTSIPKLENKPRYNFKTIRKIIENSLKTIKSNERFLNLIHLAWAPIESVMHSSKDLNILATCLDLLVSISCFSKSFLMKRIEPVLCQLAIVIENTIAAEKLIEKFSLDSKIFSTILQSLPVLVKNLEIQNEDLVLKILKPTYQLASSKNTPLFLKKLAESTLDEFANGTIEVTYADQVINKFTYAHLVWYVQN